ncbi:periplasmic lipoprotein [[Actinobacillus] muris]|uniref:Periplasmic lipoprotein n=1 Tax=Muribacter muris TaxID=67855 RepID=A0A0J5S6A2_9PAST|nr:YcfL family protein [Muribacter muris]KMK52392.1 periplasmic lipoprotein [[Actinobacillus] muris] [Muribacter muris]
MASRFFLIAFCSLLLTACGSSPVSYLPSGKQPIVNIEAHIHERIEVDARSERLQVKNLTQADLAVFYKLFWYDKQGVTQTTAERQPWQSLWLLPQQSTALPLKKPTEESVNYRIYLRGQR